MVKPKSKYSIFEQGNMLVGYVVSTQGEHQLANVTMHKRNSGQWKVIVTSFEHDGHKIERMLTSNFSEKEATDKAYDMMVLMAFEYLANFSCVRVR